MPAFRTKDQNAQEVTKNERFLVGQDKNVNALYPVLVKSTHILTSRVFLVSFLSILEYQNLLQSVKKYSRF